MDKQTAIDILGGDRAGAARAIGVSYQAIRQWPDELPDRIIDRVFAALVRCHPTDWQQRWPVMLRRSANDSATVANAPAPVSMRGARP